MKHEFHLSLTWWEKYLDDDRILLDIVQELFMKSLKIDAAELRMSEEISDRIMEMGRDAHRGKRITHDELYEEINRIAEEHGCEYGIPLPGISETRGISPMVMARGVPMREVIYANQDLKEWQERQARFHASPTEAAMELIDSGALVINSWDITEGRTICVLQTKNGPMAMTRFSHTQKLAKIMATIGARMDSHMTVEAEMRARESLKAKISDSQWRCYVLNDCFVERSKRSDLFYLFRKGYPTVVVSYHGGVEGGRSIAALCLHPMGFFQYSWAGLMTPTDEVICHLMMMRADEHKYWAKSGQWRVCDIRSGV